MLIKPILELALIVALVASGGHWPAANGTREVQVTSRIE